MSLTSFIQELSDLFAQGSPLVERIKSPQKFLAALRDLDALIEMSEAKEAVVSQIKFLLVSLASGRPYTGHMLHTVIYGPPGVGKSKLGVSLAKIWLAMGFLRKPPVMREESSRDTQKYHRDYLDITYKAKYLARKARYHKRYLDRLISYLDGILDELEGHDRTEEEEVPFVIASRPDFVGKYVGHSAPKTRAFLEANRGKVVFIDEAYSLILGDKDSFGFEALTEINKYMSEHPDDVIIQFAGYKELMQRTIFDETIGQPGLERRCAWVFDISGYSPEGLASIFRYQLSQDGWSLDSSVDLSSFFRRNKDYFKAYGGDTEKLCFYAKQAYSARLFEESKMGFPDYTSCLTLPMLEEGLERLKKNKALQPASSPEGMYL